MIFSFSSEDLKSGVQAGARLVCGWVGGSLSHHMPQLLGYDKILDHFWCTVSSSIVALFDTFCLQKSVITIQ